MSPNQVQLSEFIPEIQQDIPADVVLAELQLVMVGGGTGEVMI